MSRIQVITLDKNLMKSASTFVIILGMHRSGTSCLTGCLQQGGVFLGEVIESAPHNKKGNREKKEIMSLNESVLEYSGGSWDSPPDKVIWNNEHELERERIMNVLFSKHQLCGFKDPRTVITLPFWQEKNIKYIASYRHPLLVAASLNARNNKISISDGLLLWKAYNTKLLSYWKKHQFPLLSFNVDKEKYLLDLEKSFGYLNIDKNRIKHINFFDTSLKNQKNTISHDIPEDVMFLYEKMNNIYRNQTNLRNNEA